MAKITFETSKENIGEDDPIISRKVSSIHGEEESNPPDESVLRGVSGVRIVTSHSHYKRASTDSDILSLKCN